MGNPALVVIGPQVDRLPGGTLPVEGGNRVIPVINFMMALVPLVVFAVERHPPNHCSFGEDGEPPHCVQGTPGAEVHALVDQTLINHDVAVGTDPSKPTENIFDGTDLETYLRMKRIDHLYVCGIPTDYAVRSAVCRALDLGFSVTVVEDGICGYEAARGDTRRAIAQMLSEGAQFASSELIASHVRDKV